MPTSVRPSPSVAVVTSAASADGAGVCEAVALDGDADDGGAQYDYQVDKAAGTYSVTACFVSSNAGFADSEGEPTISVS